MTQLPTIAGFDPNALMGSKYVYNAELGRRALDFFPDLLRHTKNSRYVKAGDPFVLEEWQAILVGLMFGVVHKETGLRRFRQAYIEVPRKNGKTTLAAGIALYNLVADGEDGAEVYCAASTRDQAALLFDVAAGMTLKSEPLATNVKVRKSLKRIIYKDSYMRAVASDSHSLHGLNSSCVVVDELHALVGGGWEMFNVLETGCAARAQPLMMSITTAGHDRMSKCYELHEYAKNVRDGRIEDETFLPVVYGIGPDDDWTSEDNWAKANPNLGVSLPIEYLRQQCLKAKAERSFENAFRRLHLNQWTSQHTRWLNMDAWDACTVAA